MFKRQIAVTIWIALHLILIAATTQLVPTLSGKQDQVRTFQDTPRFERNVLPIFQSRCLNCHGDSMRQKGLDLRTRDAALKGGDSGRAIVPAVAKDSLLYQKVETGAMPLVGEKLSAKELEAIRLWIDGGALVEGEDPESAKKRLMAKQVSQTEILVNIFRNHCTTCHGKLKREAGLDLRTRAGLLKGGKAGPALIAGKPAESLVYTLVASGKMPPSGLEGSPHHVRPVRADDLERLHAWIEAGALDDHEEFDEPGDGPDPLVSREDRSFWSFQPPQRPEVPKLKSSDRVRTPIDAFLLEKLGAEGLSFAPHAERLTLMRRAYYALTGLPPSPEEVEAYLGDPAPDAYERLIDRLLASRHYGEHWGKYWLDAAGYADSNGKIDRDTIRPHAWRYRDYVIRSLNADKPYDQFLIEQMAGDELFDFKAAHKLTPQQQDYLIATGFLRTAPDNTDEGTINLVPFRLSVLEDQINIFTSAVMGLTMQCARCHNHKYDPIPQRDYYRLNAIFQSAYDPYDWLISSHVIYGGGEHRADVPDQYQRFLPYVADEEVQEVENHNAPIRKEIAALEGLLETKAQPLREKLLEERLAKLPESVAQDLRKALPAPEEKRNSLERYLVEKFGPLFKIEIKDLMKRYPEFKDEAEKFQEAIGEAKQKLKPRPKIQALFDVGGDPPPVHVFRRGNYRNIGPRVEPGVPSVLRDGLEPYKVAKPPWTTDTSGRRLALAKWLIQPGHPLTARVMVNRIWQYHFGTGLVKTSANFGKIGSKPSHPELLDWLSREFVRRGWRMKVIHRLIMTSAAYRQSSAPSPEALEADPDNSLLSRFPIRRMDGEVIYDAILKVSGRLETRMGGPADEIEINPEREVLAKPTKNEKFRRSIYLLRRRSTPISLLEVYNAPRMELNCVVRVHSTVPTQSLQLWNSERVRESARYFAGRVIDAVGGDVGKQVDRVYLTTLSRQPTDEERLQGIQVIQQLNQHWLEHVRQNTTAEPREAKAHWMALATFCHTMINSAEFIYVD